ncbi:MAG: DUF6259 domain-containing protein [Capsulimonadaceae bacterium]|nr:DUF6259 domain-containing protein [Capsulimonadaceae bacterium]
MQHVLQNEFVSFSIDEKANVCEFKNIVTGHDYAGRQGFWRLVYSHDEVLEEEILSEDCRPEISASTSGSLRIVYTSMKSVTGDEEDFALSILIQLRGDSLEFSAKISNNSSQNRIIREFNFPTIKNISLAKDQYLYSGVQKIENIAAAIAGQTSHYVAEDNKGINMPLANWGQASDGFAVIANAADGLYLGDHDATFETSPILFRKRGNEIDAGIHKSPYLAPGENRNYELSVLSPYSGDWHIGTKKYREWFDKWFHPAPRPASIEKNFNGWYRLIMRHQYGKILFRHDELPRILKSMKETGIDTLFMFGWWFEGMDAGYPNYTFDESQGGKAALKEHIREFRANGGKLILYFNGRLIDTATEFYQGLGRKIAVTCCDGQPNIERYMFEGPGIDMRHGFGHKGFAQACPYVPEWMDILKRCADTAIDLDVDGVFFDQIGFAEKPCFNKDHGHSVPALHMRAARMAQLTELREYIKQRRPEMSLGFEHTENFSCGFADYVHSCPGWNVASNDWLGKGEKPKLTTFVEFFRYTFPEIIISDREIRDDTDIERRVNLALLRGLVSDVEVHRCRSLIDETPHYKAYLTKANQLRDKYRRLIVTGLFRDTDGATCDNPELSWSVFTSGDELAVVATQSHLETTSATFTVPGYRFREWAGLGDAAVTGSKDGIAITLNRHGLATAVFVRE